MPRKKLLGECKVEGCLNELDSLGFCRLHYARFRNHGTTDLINRRGKKKHPLYSTYKDRIDSRDFPLEWKNFWKFVADVGERPSKNHYFRKIDSKKPYGKNNFEWIEHIKRFPGEEDLAWRRRKWQQRLKNKPSLKTYGKLYRDLLKETGICIEDFHAIHSEKAQKQNGLCAICFNPETGISNRNGQPLNLALDHCHRTHKIRDLLCRKCNQSLGIWKESQLLVESAIRYLTKYSSQPTNVIYNTKNKIDFLHANLEKCNYLCEICCKPEIKMHRDGKLQRLSVDHCHKTNMIRGLLCALCNTGIGKMHDSIPNLQSMIRYIQKHSS